MASFSTARTVTGAITVFAILAVSAFPGEAASRAKPRKYIFDDLVTPSMMAPPSPPVRVPTDGARFFSINSVLAKLDGKPKVDEPVRLASITSEDVLSDAPSELFNTERALQSTNEPFGLFTFRAPEGVLWRKWRAVKADIDSDLRQVESCKANSADCSDAARRFLLIVDEVRSRSGAARIETANRLINTAIRYMSDLAQHATIDVWSAPLASLGTGRGDCEDYAIAKYVVLREAGIPEQDLRVLLVRDRNVREDHAVLAIRNGEAWTVLDNRNSALTPDSELRHFKPLYALDSGGVNLFASPYLSQRQSMETKTVSPASEATGIEDTTTAWGATVDGVATSIIGTGAGAATLPVLI
jgi:predicted transglutaminase-like cysteine proteinase